MQCENSEALHLLEQHVARIIFFQNRFDMRNSSNMYTYATPITELSLKKKGSNTFCLDAAQKKIDLVTFFFQREHADRCFPPNSNTMSVNMPG